MIPSVMACFFVILMNTWFLLFVAVSALPSNNFARNCFGKVQFLVLSRPLLTSTFFLGLTSFFQESMNLSVFNLYLQIKVNTLLLPLAGTKIFIF